MTFRLSKVDELHLSDHYYLESGDVCLYCGEYTARQGYGFSETNQLIYNLKKGVDGKNKPGYQYKTQAINSVARYLAGINGVEKYTIIPVPPSKCKTDPLYDDRLVRILKGAAIINQAIQWREVVVQNSSYDASHSTSSRPSPDALIKRYSIDLTQANGIKSNIIVFDDILTAGSHFKAIQRLLKEQLNVESVIGLFIARTERDSDAMTLFDSE